MAAHEDVTKRKRAESKVRRSLAEKEVLLREIHHRVKNNLQLVSSLVQLQADQLGKSQGAPELIELAHRVRSMALVHESLYEADDLSIVDLSLYVRVLSSRLFRAYNHAADRIKLHQSVGRVGIGIDLAVPCGLIINELLSNSLRHAFPALRKGNVTIELRRLPCADASDADQVMLAVRDDGVGLPPGLDPLQSRSIGLWLVRTLSDQIGARLRFSRAEGAGGLEVELVFDVVRQHVFELDRDAMNQPGARA